MPLLPQLTVADVDQLRLLAEAAQAELENAVLDNPAAFTGLELMTLDDVATTAWARYESAAAQLPERTWFAGRYASFDEPPSGRIGRVPGASRSNASSKASSNPHPDCGLWLPGT